MKASTGLLLAGGAAVGLFLLTRKSSAAPSSTPREAFGDIGPDGSGSTVVRGQVTGEIYPVGIGQSGPGGTLYSVFSPNDPSVLLFVYLDEPADSTRGPQAGPVERVIVRRGQTDAAAVDEGLRDFGFPVRR